MLKTVTAALAATLVLTGAATAQDYPNRPVTMVIPFAAGGPTDVLGRVVAARMSEILGQQVVVENIGGAGGMTGSKRVATAAPDGYQMVLGTVGTHALGKHPAYGVLRAAGRERDHHGDRTGRINLRGGRAEQREHSRERGGHHPEHRIPPANEIGPCFIGPAPRVKLPLRVIWSQRMTAMHD